MSTAIATRKPRAVKPAKTLTIVGREAKANEIIYGIQSGDTNVYIVKLEDNKTSCNRLNGEECESYHFSTRNHKGCKHVALAIQNEQERSTDQHIHIADEQHTCISCWRRVKHANMLCYACITGEY